MPERNTLPVRPQERQGYYNVLSLARLCGHDFTDQRWEENLSGGNGGDMIVQKAHLLFEQSGTFKNAFKKFGVQAEDYDILNDFGETDHQIDLFCEINNAYTGGV